MRVGTMACAAILHRGSSLLLVSSYFVPGASVRPSRFTGGDISPARHHDFLGRTTSPRVPSCLVAPIDAMQAPLHRGSLLSAARRSRSTELYFFGKERPDPQGAGRAVARLRGGAVVAGGGIGPASVPPPLTSWIGPALSCGLSYALYNLFIKRASSLMDPMLGGVLLQVVAAALGTVLWLVTSARSAGGAGGGPPALISRGGVGWSVAAGVSVGLAEILSFVISSRGVPAMKSIPIVVGGSVWFGTILAAVWLRERVTWRGWVGVALISVGVALVGMDPSSSAVSH